MIFCLEGFLFLQRFFFFFGRFFFFFTGSFFSLEGFFEGFPFSCVFPWVFLQMVLFCFVLFFCKCYFIWPRGLRLFLAKGSAVLFFKSFFSQGFFANVFFSKCFFQPFFFFESFFF